VGGAQKFCGGNGPGLVIYSIFEMDSIEKMRSIGIYKNNKYK